MGTTTKAEETGLESFDLGNIASLSAAISEKARASERVIQIDPAQTRDNPYQPRTIRNPEADAEFNESVAASGVQQPIVVTAADENGIRTVATGHRRRDAAAHNGQLCPAIERELTDDLLECMALVENIQRENMVLYDEVRGVARMAAKHGNKETARMLGKPATYVSKAVKISGAEGSIGALLQSGMSNDTSAFYELSLLHKKAPEVADKIAKTWQDDPDQRVSLRAQVADAKTKLNNPAGAAVEDENCNAVSSAPANSAGKTKESKPKHIGYTPDSFYLTANKNGGKTLNFELSDDCTVTIELSEGQWGGFLDEVNA